MHTKLRGAVCLNRGDVGVFVNFDESGVKAIAKEKLAAFKVPRRVLFVDEDDLQTTGSAKIKTADLRKLAAERLAAEQESAS